MARLDIDRTRRAAGATLEVVFDDTLAVPPGLRALVGVDRFGSLVFQRRSRLETMRASAEAAGARLLHLRSDQDRADLIERLREADDDRLYLHCPSHMIDVSGADLTLFLRQLQHSPQSLHIPLEGRRDRRGWALLRGPLLKGFLMRLREGDTVGFFDDAGVSLADVPGRVKLIDVSDERTLLDFLSGQFDARHFNAIEHDDYTVTKRSADRGKMKREFEFYRLMPPAIQMFLVQPFDFRDDGETASYRMERIAIPDMALQWVHGAFQADEFDRFLKHIFHFVSVRPAKRVAKTESEAARLALYLDKVEARIGQLKRLPGYAALEPLLERGVGGADALMARYMAAYEKRLRGFPSGQLVAGHGDLCFSNILYSKSNQYLKLIDPRGATGEADVYTDPNYDVAKLSHSVLGGYDLINNDKFDVLVDEGLGLRMAFETRPPAFARPLFANHLERAGFDLDLIRLCEASLFISMLPLHMDRPRKVLAFALRAGTILDELEGKRPDAE
jgi:hypothetical protein